MPGSPPTRGLTRIGTRLSGRDPDTYGRANAGAIPNHGESYRAGEIISSSLAESAVNQVIAKRMVKTQQMR